MKSLVALVHREYLEHKGAFVYAPLIILAVLTVILVGSLMSNRFHMAYEVGAPSALKFFQFGFFAISALWFLYLIAALFFYYADAFNADRRNNSMLFWKSMPVSDFKILSSKMLAGLTVFPALIFLASLMTGVLVYFTAMAAVLIMPRLALPGVLEFVGGAWDVASFTFVYLVVALLWYAPFFAWVGSLSTMVGRWAIPLAFLIPGLVGLGENLIVERAGDGPGYVLSYFRRRIQPPHFEGPGSMESFFRDDPVGSGRLVAQLLLNVDWAQLAGGLIVAALLVFFASEYRRRYIAT